MPLYLLNLLNFCYLTGRVLETKNENEYSKIIKNNGYIMLSELN